ncbi:MAG: hypothetical protein SFU98_18710 [Leptospiraceae bacterium]|nr:hypothetical protein [Leptospiraceae bacterium]
MKGFKFNLATVQKLRERKVEEEIRKLSLIAGRVNKLAMDISENQKLIQEAYKNFAKDISYDINYLRVYDGYIKGLNRQNEQLQRTIESEDEILNEARAKLNEARKEAEVIEIIKRKREKEFRERIFRSERMEEDDLNSKDYLLDKRKLKYEDAIPQTLEQAAKPKLKKNDSSGKKEQKSGYELLKDYYESFKK